MDEVAEAFALDGSLLNHHLRVGDAVVRSSVEVDSFASNGDPKGVWWKSYMAGAVPTPVEGPAPVLRVVDLFSGAGGLALGVRQLAADMGRKVVTELIVDQDAAANAVYAANHDTRLRSKASVSSLVDFRLRGWEDDAVFVYPPEVLDSAIAEATQAVDLLIAGPPCQGNSNLNNHSRRNDKRNELYLTVPAFAVAAGARNVVIENVPGVVHDRSRVVQTAERLFEAAGYRVTTGVLAAHTLGWPQTRRRFFMVASLDSHPIPLAEVERALSDPQPRSVLWAIGGLETLGSKDVLDQPTGHNHENQDRIDWLFDNDEYDLPLSERPECHKDGTTYRSVYGRMKPSDPAPTITTGFMSPGRGRFTHPTERRTLTAREAAVIQGFPYGYRFVTDPRNPPTRSQLAKWIGDAVPMPLGYAAALSVLGPEITSRPNRDGSTE